MATQVKGTVTREMIDRGEMPGDRCPVAMALKVGVRNIHADVAVFSRASGGRIEVYGKQCVRDAEYTRVREWIENYDDKSYIRRRDLVDPISFTLTFEGEFS